MEASLKVQPIEKMVFDASPTFPMPGRPNCFMQVAHIHRLKDSEENYEKHNRDLSMMMLRNHEGLAAPIRYGMELHSARKIGRLPFLQSSNMMEDVLLGRDDAITFSDFLNMPENNEFMSQPHVVVEKSLGIF